MKRTTTAATTATAIRNDLKLAFPGIKFSVRSETYSGGNSVNIEYNDGVNRARVEQLLAKYEMGWFNGMEEIYEINNRREDVPQVKFIFVRRQMSAETKIVVAAEIGITPATFAEYNNSVGEWNETLIYRHFVTLEFGQHANISTPVEIAELKTIADDGETKFQQTKRVEDSDVAFYAFRKYRVAVLSTGITLAEFIADNPNKYNALSAGERWQMELNGTKPETDDTDGDDDGGGVVLVTDGDEVDLVGLLFDENAGHSNANEIPIEYAVGSDDTPDAFFFINNKRLKLDGYQIRPAYPHAVVFDIVFETFPNCSVRGLHRVFFSGVWWPIDSVLTKSEMSMLSMAEMVQKIYDQHNAAMFEFMVYRTGDNVAVCGQFHAIELLPCKKN